MSRACAICARHARIVAVKASRDVDALIALIDELHDELSNTEEELNYKSVILDGSWPSAVHQLEEALIRARAKEAETKND